MLEGVYDFMRENDAIQDLSSFYVSSLFRQYEKGQEQLQLVGNDFRYHLVDDVAKRNWSKFIRSANVLFLRYEGDES